MVNGCVRGLVLIDLVVGFVFGSGVEEMKG